MTTPALVQTYAPEFLGYNDDVIQPFLDLALRRHVASAWGTLFADAMAFYAAHCLKQSGVNSDGTGTVAGFISGAAGPLVAQKDHNLSRTYGSAATAGGGGAGTVEEAELMETGYGRKYLALRKTRAAGKPSAVQVTPVTT